LSESVLDLQTNYRSFKQKHLGAVEWQSK